MPNYSEPHNNTVIWLWIQQHSLTAWGDDRIEPQMIFHRDRNGISHSHRP